MVGTVLVAEGAAGLVRTGLDIMHLEVSIFVP
jgi:hypothetical protein